MCFLLPIVGIGLAVMTLSGKVAPWTGRFYSLLDPSYAKNNIPIIASVSEHQPTSWSSFYFDLQILTFLFPAGTVIWKKKWQKTTDLNCTVHAWFNTNILIFVSLGLYYCFTRMTDHIIFIILYGVTSVYFAGVMVSLKIFWIPIFDNCIFKIK